MYIDTLNTHNNSHLTAYMTFSKTKAEINVTISTDKQMSFGVYGIRAWGKALKGAIAVRGFQQKSYCRRCFQDAALMQVQTKPVKSVHKKKYSKYTDILEGEGLHLRVKSPIRRAVQRRAGRGTPLMN